MARVSSMIPYAILLLVLAISAVSYFPLTRAQGLTCEVRIDGIDAPSSVDPAGSVTVKGHLVISCSPSQLTVVVRVDLVDQITGKSFSSDSISLGYIGSKAKTLNETSSNTATAPSITGPWRLTLNVSVYAAGQVIASATETFAIQVGQVTITPSTTRTTASTLITSSSAKTTSATTEAAGGGLGGNLMFYVLGAVVAVAVIASFLVFSRRKGGPSAPVSQPAKSEVVLEAPRVKPAVLPAQPVTQPIISTGYTELDNMLAGGLPLGYAILIVSPPCDEKDLLFRKIIDSGLSSGKPVFFLSRDLGRTQDLAGKYREDFYAFHAQADKIAAEHPNIFKIASVENLNDLNISLTKSVETLVRQYLSKIIILDILSDVLLQHKALTTRRWLDDFISKRKSEGFTILGTLNPLITSKTESQSIIDLFDGIIEIYERELRERARRFLIVKKMYGRRYQETELMLDKDKLF